MFSYTISKEADNMAFLKACTLIEDNFKEFTKEKTLIDVDGSVYQKYHTPQGDIEISNDYNIDAVYIDSEMSLSHILTEIEIAKAYEGKPYIAEKLRKIAIGSGNKSAVVYNYRITESQGNLIGITDEIFNKWCEDGIYFGVIIDLDITSGTIENCRINKTKLTQGEDGKSHHTKLAPTQQEIEIFVKTMEYITQ